MQKNKPKKKLGLALSGAGARSSFYLGFLDGLREAGVDSDYIVAQSGAAIATAGFACGTEDFVKKWMEETNGGDIFRLLTAKDDEQQSFVHLGKMKDFIFENVTQGKTFEEVYPHLIFVATDLNSGKAVKLEMGDIAEACRISCTVPGIFAPVPKGKTLLVDGGLVSYIPGDIARDSGAEVVVGVSVRATKHIFYGSFLKARTWYNKMGDKLNFKKLLGFTDTVKKDKERGFVQTSDLLAEIGKEPSPNAFSVVGRAMDIALQASKQTLEDEKRKFGCDLLIFEDPEVFGGAVKLKGMADLYEKGRKIALERAEEIKQLIY